MNSKFEFAIIFNRFLQKPVKPVATGFGGDTDISILASPACLYYVLSHQFFDHRARARLTYGKLFSRS
jgi:hypothetical protein